MFNKSIYQNDKTGCLTVSSVVKVCLSLSIKSGVEGPWISFSQGGPDGVTENLGVAHKTKSHNWLSRIILFFPVNVNVTLIIVSEFSI